MAGPVDDIRRPRRAAPGSPKPAKEVAESREKPKDAEPAGEPETPAFQDVLAGVAGVPGEKRLGALLKEIRLLADVLARRRLLEDLEEYRTKVGQFLRVYLDEVLVVREASGRRGLSRRKQLIVVKRVDVELEELSRMVLGGAPGFEVVKELETIEGLLIDLYR